jgi:hypothetical protein
MGVIKSVLDFLGLLPSQVEVVPPPPPPDETVPPPDPLPSLEVFAQPGHGKTTYLWSILFILQKMILFWPNYDYSAQDDETQEILEKINNHIHEGLLPREQGEARYDLRIQNMERWGQKNLTVWDWPDSVFATGNNGTRTEEVNWNSPALWLVSLPDLKGRAPETLGGLFDKLIRKRIRAGHSANPQAFRLVVVLTKGDSMPDLPPPLRQYLKEDPLWKDVQKAPLLSAQPQGIAAGSSHALGSESLGLYLGTLSRVHEMIQEWIGGSLAGSMLIRRAREYHVDLRFSIISSTGSGAVAGETLQLPWTPRRVLDPLFWALEFDSFPAR